MRLLTILLTFTSLQAAAHSYGQVSLSVKDEPLEKVLVALKKQSGYEFFYNESMMRNAQPVTLSVKGLPLEQVLELCFNNQPRLGYVIISRTVVIKDKPLANPLPTEEALPPPPIEVKGRVVDENGQPVAGASVQVKGTTNGTSTDANGNFTLSNVDDKATLVITSVNIEPMEVKVNGRTTIAISAKIAVKEEEIVVAYGTRTRTNNTGAVTVVKGEQIQSLPNRSFDKSLQGLVPGLLVTPGSGLPGGGTSNFVIRGVATNAQAADFSTVRNPLIIIDGVPVTQETSQIMYRNGRLDYGNAVNNPLAQLNSSDIESITVLKDAAAIALYGAKSSNGVILVTTKRGKAGATRFGFRQQTDIAFSKNPYDMLNQSDYLSLLIETHKNTNPTLYPNDASVIAALKNFFPTRSDGSFYPEVNWYDEMNKNHALTLSNEFYISGGDEKTNFYLGLDYTNQEGIRRKTSFDRKSLRFNFEKRPTTWLRLGLNSTVSHSVQNYGASAYGSSRTTAGLSVIEISPLNPVRLENGDYLFNFSRGGSGAGTNYPNPVAQLEYNTNRITSFRGLMRLYGEIGFLKNFKLLTSFGTDFSLSESKEKNDPRLFDPLLSTLNGRIEEQDSRTFNLITTNILRYSKQLNKDNSISILFGQEAQVLNRKILDIAVKGITNPYYDQITSPGAVIHSQYGLILKETLLSYFSQLNYDFKSRYFITASVRRDGSSRFGEDKRYGTYWATGAGWLVSSEPFMRITSKWLNYFKIRGSIGAAGNAAAIDRFTPYDRLQTGIYLNGTTVRPDLVRAGNPDVKWENTFSWNAGLDIRLFNGKIGLTGDIYARNTSNLIYSIPLPFNSGNAEILGNIGKMQNTGLEFSVNVDIIKGNEISWNINANWAKNTNLLTKIEGTSPAATLSFISNREGESFGSFYLRRWAGVNPDNGMAQWVDSTGKITTNYNATKPELVGKSQPDGFGSVINTFKYKGFELSIMLYYQYGYQIYNGSQFINDGRFPYANQSRGALDHWRKPGDIAANPKRLLNDPNGFQTKQSTRYLFNGDHIRLQNIILSYNLGSKKLKQIGIKETRLFIQGNNLAFWTTKSSTIDPSGSTVFGAFDIANVPIPKSLSIGINMIF